MAAGIGGQRLDVTVLAGRNLRDTEFFTKQDPYVVITYGSSRFRTRTCTDGGRNPTFDDKFQVALVEGLREMNVEVWNSNTFTPDVFIGGGRVQLHKVLSEGYDDSSWQLQSRQMRNAGELKLVLRYANAGKQKPSEAYASMTPHKPTASSAPPSLYPVVAPYPPTYLPDPAAYLSPPAYPAQAAYTPPSPYAAYPPPSPPAGYPPQAYPPGPLPQTYPPPQYPPHTSYPPPVYPPPTYPPSTEGKPSYPPAPYPYPPNR